MTRTRLSAALAATFTLAVLAACSRSDPAQYVASARDYLARSDVPAATIQARNAVKAQPESAEARLLLGRALLAGNDPVAAEAELRRALEFGASRDEVLPLLAQALLGRGRAEALVREFAEKPPADPAARAQFDAALGDAYTVLRRRDDAARAYRAALAADPASVPARLGLAQIEAQSGRFDAALQATEAVIADAPKSGAAYALRSDILLAKRDRAGARRALEQAAQADPAFLPARYSLVGMLIDEGAYDPAREQLAGLAKIAGNDIRTVYFQSALSFRTGDLPAARDGVAQILKAAPDHVPARVLAARIDAQSGQFASAEAHLRRALAQAPDHIEARRLLAATYLRSGQAARARQELAPLLDGRTAQDPQLLLLAAEASLAGGDVKQATSYFRKVADAGEGNPAAVAHTRLGQIAMANGRPDDGVRELEQAGIIDPSFRAPDVALVESHLRSGALDKALAAARALEKKSPKDPTTHQLLGTVHLARRDRAAARASFERALALDPTLVPAARALAELDVADNNADAARRRYEAMIARAPRNAAPPLALAELQLRTGAKPADVVPTLRSAVAADPSSLDARLALVSALTRAGDPRGALAAARDASAALPDRVPLLQALAALQAEAGERQQVRETLRRLAQLTPGDAAPLQRVAAAQAGRKNYDAALDTLRIAKEVAPANADVARDLIVVHLAAGRPDDALQEARAVWAAAPRSAAGWLLESQVHEHQRRFDEAESALRQGLKAEPASGVLAARLHGVLLAAGKAADAESHARRWIAEHPKDTVFRTQIGDRALAAKQYDVAAGHYRAVLAVEPDSVVALNNLAWIGGRSNDPKALQYAERAVKLAPRSAAVLDTMGTLLVAQGDAKRGVDYLARAARLAPARADIRLNYAKALTQAGLRDEARRELEALQATPSEFPGKSEVPALLSAL